jgi:hypothetical protein
MFNADATAEHIELESGESHREPTAAVRVLERIELRDPLRRATLRLTLFEEGVVELRGRRDGRTARPWRFDLEHLDPAPVVTRRFAKRTLIAAAAAAGVAAALGTLAALVASQAAVFAAGTAAAAFVAAACLLAAARRSGETVAFVTRNGRVPVLELSVAYGAVRRLRKMVPRIAAAIEHAVDEDSLDTGIFLRAEMREHYRLRSDGALTDEQCASGTSRILARFDAVR